ncbi:MAG: PIG-L family deacetylase, partial [bacterium]|nr:PIG-L family deacetylase [bacterium]
LNKFRDIKNRICPDIVFCPSEKDLHQDHATVGKEAMREFRDTTLLAYDNPWKFFDFKPDVFVRMNALTLERKIEAVQCYESQKGKKFCDKEAIKSWAITRGALVRLEYAEAFELKHMIL